MIKENRKKLYELMTTLCEEYTPDKAISKLKAELWFNQLEQYSLEIIEQAVYKIIRTRTLSSFPKISEIIREIEGSNENEIIDNWLLFKDTIALVGAYTSVQFENPILNSMVEALGGWPKVCEVLEDDLKWMQRDFEKLYPALKKRKNHPKVMLGIADQYNNTNGYLEYVKPPVLIENRKDQPLLIQEKKKEEAKTIPL
jgi:hypothetical protein